ncbi:Com family DNA-binding transcriptional regulator [uncultured Desulfovibrio sp.]|uniref:Com family DNA-binding transcriptional regulator n=1 Tax=uncultured Desulfovibrio sp. TaxID=167968 RepID=UPI0025E7EAFC|nr:Com family DNA-binding transcriptional regulator [uncultured Desulfovibrio sp.]
MNKRDLPEIRCPHCNKLIARGEALDMEFKCGRCKTFFILRGTRPGAERPERPQERFHAESRQPV